MDRASGIQFGRELIRDGLGEFDQVLLEARAINFFVLEGHAIYEGLKAALHLHFAAHGVHHFREAHHLNLVTSVLASEDHFPLLHAPSLSRTSRPRQKPRGQGEGLVER